MASDFHILATKWLQHYGVIYKTASENFKSIIALWLVKFGKKF